MRLSNDTSLAERFFAALPGWIYLACGLTVLALAMVVPAWVKTQELKHQQQAMAAQAERLESLNRRYRSFHAAVRAGDPVVLERLAWVQLGWTTSDKLPVRLDSDAPPISPLASIICETPIYDQCLPDDDGTGGVAAIENWLHASDSKQPIDTPPPPQYHSRLVRWTTGPQRVGLLGFGVIAIAGGLFSGRAGASS